MAAARPPGSIGSSGGEKHNSNQCIDNVCNAMLPRGPSRSVFIGLVFAFAMLVVLFGTHLYRPRQLHGLSDLGSGSMGAAGWLGAGSGAASGAAGGAGGRRSRPVIKDSKSVPRIRGSPYSDPEARPWFMIGGKVHPSPATLVRSPYGQGWKRNSKIWPEEDPSSDRVYAQLMFIPPKPRRSRDPSVSTDDVENFAEDILDEDDPPAPPQPPLKHILFYNGVPEWEQSWKGRNQFIVEQCPVNTCTITDNKAEASTADAIVFRNYFRHPNVHRPSKQVWILHFLECPYHTPHIKFNDVFNWTATYRRDSDIVTPYERWLYFDPRVRQKSLSETKNYAANKTSQVAWFVSNCAARNNRLQYAAELSKYIQVDIYGACGTKKCLRTNANECFQMLQKNYKFYLAFENSNCKDYITEKFFVNGLGHNVLPIVMGAQPEDYARSAPEHSYLHVDDFESPKALAAYLNKLDKDDRLYNEYFRWKGTGEFIDTHFLCRLCAMLHDDYPVKTYRDVNRWWREPGVCTTGSWRKQGKHHFTLPSEPTDTFSRGGHIN